MSGLPQDTGFLWYGWPGLSLYCTASRNIFKGSNPFVFACVSTITFMHYTACGIACAYIDSTGVEALHPDWPVDASGRPACFLNGHSSPSQGCVEYYLVLRLPLPLQQKRVYLASHFTLRKSRKMPFVELITNVSLTRAQTEELALSLSACAAETLQKPEFAFGVNVRANEVLTFAGNWDPCMPPRSLRVASELPFPRG